MAWFKMDDQLYGHKKTRRAGVEAMGLWAVCGAWSAAHEEDGFVPDYVAETFTTKCTQYANRLVRAGFWVEATKDGDKGWQFHDWNEYQPTSEQQQAKRDKWAEWKRNSRSQHKVSTPDIETGQPDMSGVSTVGQALSQGGVRRPRPVPSRPDKDFHQTQEANARAALDSAANGAPGEAWLGDVLGLTET